MLLSLPLFVVLESPGETLNPKVNRVIRLGDVGWAVRLWTLRGPGVQVLELQSLVAGWLVRCTRVRIFQLQLHQRKMGGPQIRGTVLRSH